MDSRNFSRRLASGTAAATMLILLGCGGSGAGKPAAGADPSSPSAAPGGAGAVTPPPAVAGQAAPAQAQPPAPRPQGAPQAAPRIVVPDSPVPPGVDPKKPIASVNGHNVVAEKVYSVYQMNKLMLQQRGRTLNPTEDQMLRNESLQVVMADELLYQAALQAGIKSSPAEVDASMKQWRARAGSEDNIQRFLKASSMTMADVHTELERNSITEAYRKTLIAGKGVTEEQARSFYAGNQDMFKVPEQAHVQYILVKASDKEPESVRADAKKRAEEAQKRAAAGEDFGALAKQYSQDATAAKGGDIGAFPRGVMFPKFEEIAFGLKPGGVSEVFQTPNGFNVLKLVEMKPAGVRAFDEIKTQLMLEMGRAQEEDIVKQKLRVLGSTAKVQLFDPAFAPPPEASQTQAPAPKPPVKQ
jgi:parvulin-like peptidyl-prolyl isomerase